MVGSVNCFLSLWLSRGECERARLFCQPIIVFVGLHSPGSIRLLHYHHHHHCIRSRSVGWKAVASAPSQRVMAVDQRCCFDRVHRVDCYYNLAIITIVTIANCRLRADRRLPQILCVNENYRHRVDLYITYCSIDVPLLFLDGKQLMVGSGERVFIKKMGTNTCYHSQTGTNTVISITLTS